MEWLKFSNGRNKAHHVAYRALTLLGQVAFYIYSKSFHTTLYQITYTLQLIGNYVSHFFTQEFFHNNMSLHTKINLMQVGV